MTPIRMRLCLSVALTAVHLWATSLTSYAVFPTYSVTKVSDLVARPLQAGVTDFVQRTFSISAGPNGKNFATVLADFSRPIDPPNTPFVTAHEEFFITDPSNGTLMRNIAPPPGYETGLSSLTRISQAGHLAFTVSSDRQSADWLAGIEIARANPNGTVDILTGLRGAEQRGVNALGQVVAVGSNEATVWRYTNGTGWQDLGALPGTSEAVPIGMNDLGTVVGRGTDPMGNPKPFYYTDSGGMQTFTDGAGNALFGEANAVNNNGLIAGTANGRAFVFNGSTMEFNFVTPATSQQVVDINSAGAILGVFYTPPILGFIPGNLGWIATKNDGFSLLENLIDQDSSDPEWRIIDAKDINDDGWILGTAFNFRDQKNYQILLRPVPESGTSLLILITGGLWLSQRKRRTSA